MELPSLDLENVVLDRRPVVVAHRGASSLAPENTLAAFSLALDMKSEWVEIDIHRSSDGELVVIHDHTLDRTTDGKGAISDLTCDVIRGVDAGSWFGPQFAGEKVPTVRETLELCRGKATLLVELKQSGIEADVVDLVREMGMEKEVVFQSFDHQSMGKIRSLAPEIPAMILVYQPQFSEDKQRAAEWTVQTAQQLNVNGISIYFGQLTSELVSLARENDLMVFSWTVDPSSLMVTVIGLGVDGVITNRPQDLLPMLEKVNYKE